MKTILLFIASITFVNDVFADEPNCSRDDIYQGLIFELSVDNALRPDMVFKFCVGPESSYLISEIYLQGYVSDFGIRPDLKYQTKLKLTNEHKGKIDDLYRNALAYSRPDDARGLDGSSWCFRPKSGNTYTEYCYWSPAYDPDNERRLKDISELGIYLFELSELEKHGGELH